jgi:hypothetical protein
VPINLQCSPRDIMPAIRMNSSGHDCETRKWRKSWFVINCCEHSSAFFLFSLLMPYRYAEAMHENEDAQSSHRTSLAQMMSWKRGSS